MKFLERKLAWALTLKPGDKVEDEFCEVQEIARIENVYEYREPNWFPIVRTFNQLALDFVRGLFSRKTLIDRYLHFSNGYVASAINACEAIDDEK